MNEIIFQRGWEKVILFLGMKKLNFSFEFYTHNLIFSFFFLSPMYRVLIITNLCTDDNLRAEPGLFIGVYPQYEVKPGCPLNLAHADVLSETFYPND